MTVIVSHAIGSEDKRVKTKGLNELKRRGHVKKFTMKKGKKYGRYKTYIFRIWLV